MSNDRMDTCYSIGKSNGSIGAELIGPDGVGFMLFYHEERKNELRKALVKERLEELRFRFDFSASRIIYNV
jgi:galactokinase/mevalonate kinase-like predicted kinase